MLCLRDDLLPSKSGEVFLLHIARTSSVDTPHFFVDAFPSVLTFPFVNGHFQSHSASTPPAFVFVLKRIDVI